MHVSAGVYRARRRFVAAVLLTSAVLLGTAVHSIADDSDSDRAAAEPGGPRPQAAGPVTPSATPRPAAGSTARATARPATTPRTPTGPPAQPAENGPQARPDDPRLPASGSGRRVVYSIGHQRVWLVDGTDRVVRTYRVSGARDEYVDPGTFHVFSASRNAIAWDHKSTMRWMVRFARGTQTSIGFHDIPLLESGRPVQSPAQLGMPLSDGCIRQTPADARALFDFAPVGTEVVVAA